MDGGGGFPRVRSLLLCVGVVFGALSFSRPVAADGSFSQELGDQDFADGEAMPGDLGHFVDKGSGEPPPFDHMTLGSDIEEDDVLDASWTFQFGGMSKAASLTFGICDSDAMIEGEQVGDFSIDGEDWTSVANFAFEERGGGHFECNVFSFCLPRDIPADGLVVVNLTLQPPSTGLPSETLGPGNGGAMDFSRLDIPPVDDCVARPTGDVDCLGIVDALDALLILQLHAALIEALACGELGDVNLDGILDPIDAALVLQHEAGLVLSLPL